MLVNCLQMSICFIVMLVYERKTQCCNARKIVSKFPCFWAIFVNLATAAQLSYVQCRINYHMLCSLSKPKLPVNIKEIWEVGFTKQCVMYI